MNRKHSLLCLMIVICMMSGCASYSQTDLQEASIEMPSEDNELLYITEADVQTEYTDPEYIDLSDIEDDFVIEDAGEYVLSGDYKKTLKIDVHDQMVHLFLDNLHIETAIGPAIEIASAGKVVITLLPDSANTFFDSAYYKDEELNAAISSECDLTINGPGTLYVCGYYKDAIHSKDVFKLLGGQVQLRSKRYGIKGNDGMVLSPTLLMIESEKNGCQTSNADKEGKGIIDIRGGEISIVAGEYGLSSASDLYIQDGQVYLNSVISDIYTEGKQYIAEGTIVNE